MFDLSKKRLKIWNSFKEVCILLGGLLAIEVHQNCVVIIMNGNDILFVFDKEKDANDLYVKLENKWLEYLEGKF